MTMNIAVIGFGVVGQGLAEILLKHGARIERETGASFQVVAVCDMLKGSVHDPGGLDLAALLDLVRSGRSLEGLEAPHKGWDALTTIRQTDCEAICEATYTDLQTGEPATSHLRAAIETGKHIATTNKGPVALFGKELQEAAGKAGVKLLAEGTVVSGTPILNLAQGPMAGIGVRAVKGILNGTTNYILTEMEQGAPYAEVLKRAQELGYAEADPTGDVEGWDAAGKVTILANLLMGGDLRPSDIDRTGIIGISDEDIKKAKAEGKRWKLIGETSINEDGTITGKVAPQALDLSDPLAGVSGATNALTFQTELMGPITIVGAGAGKIETGYSLLTDLIAIWRATR